MLFGLIVFDTSNTIHNILLLKRLIQCPLSFSIYLGFKKIINFEFRSYDNTLIMTPSLLQNISLCHSLYGLTITIMCNTTMKLFPPTTLWKIVNGELIETLNILPPLTNYCFLIATFNYNFSGHLNLLEVSWSDWYQKPEHLVLLKAHLLLRNWRRVFERALRWNELPFRYLLCLER